MAAVTAVLGIPAETALQEMEVIQKIMTLAMTAPVMMTRETVETLDTMIMGMGMILAGAGVFCCACMAGWRRAYRLLLFNENFQNQKGKRRK